MVSLAMAVQDQYGGTNSSLLLPDGNGIASSSGLHNVTGLDMKDQFSCGSDYAPKARKPYTITKQRERWTEEEHKKFLEALKLYGRAWRKIEEHVGSKTAVQIRSHAQKFFTKVVRESSGSNTSPMEPIEIPPPRPKRKPMHPYPRKLACPIVKEVSNAELPRRSLSPNSSASEHENQSPTSVLSAVGSDTFVSSDSNTPNGSLSPVSCVDPIHSVGIKLTHPNSSPEENGTPSPGPVTGGSVPVEQSLTDVMELGLFPQDYVKEVSLEEASTRSLKLFGRTVLVTDSHRPSSPTVGTSKSFPSDMNEGKPLEFLPLSSGNTKCAWSHLPDATPGALYCMQFPDKKSNMVELSSSSSLPWWTFYGSMPFPISPYHKQEPPEMHLDSCSRDVQDKEFQKEGSWTGSNSKSLNQEDNVDKNSDFETQSCRQPFDRKEKEPASVFELKPSEKSAFSVIKSSPEKCMKGFVPYKRRMSERETHSSTITSNGRAEQRIRLTSQ